MHNLTSIQGNANENKLFFSPLNQQKYKSLVVSSFDEGCQKYTYTVVECKLI